MTQPPVTLAEFRDHLNLDSDEDSSQDEERWNKLVAATDLVEDKTGPIRPRATTSKCTTRSGFTLMLPEYPVLSVESVKDADDVPLAIGDLDIDLEAGQITSFSALSSRFYTATYTVGYDPIPHALMEAVLVVAAQLWESQRGPAGTHLSSEAPPVSRGFAFPNRAKELIAPYRQATVA